MPTLRRTLAASLTIWEFDFRTNVAPDPGHVPGQPTWKGPREGVAVNGDQAIIKCVVTKIGGCWHGKQSSMEKW